MSVWLTIPSKRPDGGTVHLWQTRGYKVALWIDTDLEAEGGKHGDALLIIGNYPGYAQAVNALIAAVMRIDPFAEWFIAAGDDVEPDMTKDPEVISIECKCHFYNNLMPAENNGRCMGPDRLYTETLGVMQPTGDRWGDNERSRQRFGKDREAYADRVCGSPWIGREFAKRINQGCGPLWPEYFHMFEDEELFNVATKYGLLWQRRDLTHLHKHWGRGPIGNDNAMVNLETHMPDFLKRANSAEEWYKAMKLHQRRQAEGYPGSELL
jgi:hypothetical protein